MVHNPPDDPEEWSDDRWIEWLRASDDSPDDGIRPPARGSWSPGRSGSVLAGALWGLHEALYGPREDRTFIEASADTLQGPDGLSVHLNEEDPRRSWALLHSKSETPQDEHRKRQADEGADRPGG